MSSSPVNVENIVYIESKKKYVENILEKILSFKLSLNFKIVVGGVDMKRKEGKLVNLIILIGKWTIHKYNTCNLKYSFPSMIMLKNELLQRAEAQNIKVLRDVLS